MPTSTRRECCVPVVERARSFLGLVCDAPALKDHASEHRTRPTRSGSPPWGARVC